MVQSHNSSSSHSVPNDTKHGKPRTCKADKCNERVAHSKTTGEYSRRWCQHHVCWAGVGVCGTQTKIGQKYCPAHDHCKQPGCRVKLVDPNVQYSKIHGDGWYCPNHSCAVTINCSRCCEAPHPGSRHCPQHREECTRTSCEKDCLPGKTFCSRHACQTAGCSREVFNAGRARTMCRRHQPCSVGDCRSYCVVGADKTVELYCENHEICKCDVGTCDAVIARGSNHCPEHKCLLEGCPRARDLHLGLRFTHCRDHTCARWGCPERIADLNDPMSRNCPRHTCRVDGCTQQIAFRGRLCDDHSCLAEGCGNQTAGGRPHCEDHQCQDPGCQQVAKLPGGYCVAQACEREGCGHRRGDPQYPNLCDFHGREQLREDSLLEGEERARARSRERRQRWNAQGARARSPEGAEYMKRRYRDHDREVNWRNNCR